LLHFSTIILSSFGPLVLRKLKRAENSTLFYNLSHLVLWSFRNDKEQRMLHISTIDPIWSSGPDEISKSRECNTFLLFIPFGPLVLTKFTREAIASFFYHYIRLIWSSGPLEIEKSREHNSFLLFIPFGPLVFTKFTRAAIAPLF
jgi:hypothetical protein